MIFIEEQIKNNILTKISKQYSFDPACVPDLLECKKQLFNVIQFCDATIEVMERIQKEKRIIENDR